MKTLGDPPPGKVFSFPCSSTRRQSPVSDGRLRRERKHPSVFASTKSQAG